MKFSLLTLLGAVAIAALGCAALSHAVQGSVMAAVTATILVLFGALLAAIECRGAARAFWRAFAILGWGYLLTVWVCLERELVPTTGGRMLATTWILDKLVEATIEPGTSPISTAGGLSESEKRWYWGDAMQKQSAPVVTFPDGTAWLRLLQIGHALWALLFAFAGGALARWLYVRRERPV